MTVDPQFLPGLELSRALYEEGVRPVLAPYRRPYRSRPCQVIRADRFAAALHAGVEDPRLRDLPLTGSVDQWADSTDFLLLKNGAQGVSIPGSPVRRIE